MKARKHKQKDPYRLNKQLENAFIWLRSNKHIRTAAELARVWGLSETTVSSYRKMRRTLGRANASVFEHKLLRRHNLTLKDFDTTVLVEQAKLVHTPTATAIASLTTTKLLLIESGQEIILDKLEEIMRELGELREQVKKVKLTGKASS